MKPLKKRLKMKKISILIAFFVSLMGFAQDYTGNIPPVSKEGLYRLLLTPEIRSAAQENLNSLRIVDSQNLEVPYVLIYNSDQRFSTFQPISIFSKEIIKDSITSIVIQNTEGLIQERIGLQIANTDSTKKYTVFGSNDQRTWYGLVTNGQLGGLNSRNGTVVEKTIDLPLHSYKFIKINFKDRETLPIHILNVGVHQSSFFTQKPIEISAFQQEVLPNKNNKSTRIKFRAATSHKIHRISFAINTQFFSRNARLLVQKTKKIKKREEIIEVEMAQFQLHSKKDNHFVLSHLNAKEFVLEIDNQDNPPLQIEAVRLFQKPVYLIAQLQAQETYQLLIDPDLQMPSYDLENFISSNTKVIDDISIGHFSTTPTQSEELKPLTFWQTPLFMWICIALGAVFIGYFAFGLLKEINNEDAA